jgi:uncharacterized membrane protein
MPVADFILSAVNPRRLGLTVVCLWFSIGGIAHFAVPEFFLKIVPPNLPFRLEAVYLSGACELIFAAGLLRQQTRRAAGIGLILLTIAVTPANFYMLLHAALFPAFAEWLLALRLVLQVALLVLIWWVTQRKPGLDEQLRFPD